MVSVATGGGGGNAWAVSPPTSSRFATTTSRRGGGGGGRRVYYGWGLRLLVVGAVAASLALGSYRKWEGLLVPASVVDRHDEPRRGGGDDGGGAAASLRQSGTTTATLTSTNSSHGEEGGSATTSHPRRHPSSSTASEGGDSGPDRVDDEDDDDADKDCPYRHSRLHRRIYVYPNRGTEEYTGSILSDSAREMMAAAMKAMAAAAAAGTSVGGGTNDSSMPPLVMQPWQWMTFEQQAKEAQGHHYDLESEWIQYDTEILVRELITDPRSCLRTHDPDRALLFYVPYMRSLEITARQVAGKTQDDRGRLVQSRYGRAIWDAIVNHNYTGWESPDLFGLTSKYWERNNGSDHVLVYSEPMHGLYHDWREGSYHPINTQVQLHPPIAVSIELTKTFVRMHPACARKNILLPHPNPDGRWFNGVFDRQTREVLEGQGISNAAEEPGTLQQDLDQHGLATMFFKTGDKGLCNRIRVAVRKDFETCSASYRNWHYNITPHYRHGMRISTFCPAPIGDTPSAKRMFDSLHAGCIPVVLSTDFVWPFTTDIYGNGTHGGGGGGESPIISPDDFSLRLPTSEYDTSAYNHSTCQLLDEARVGLEARLSALPREQIQNWQSNLRTMSDLYSWYKRDPDLPDHPLRDGRVPDGKLAHMFVRLLEERSDGSLWAKCREELAQQRQQPPLDEPRHFVC